MAQKSDIEWTQSTWNPVTGCTKISSGCKNCYAERMAERLRLMGQRNYAQGFQLTLQPHMLELPLTWKTPQTIFVNSMSDLFHDGVPLSYIRSVFDIMRQASWHRFQVLTKRSKRLRLLSPRIDWPSNVWMGVSVESEDHVSRIDDLRRTGSAIKFLSLEPLLGPLRDLNLRDIDWVIVGGESGPRSRPIEEDWIVNLRDQCQKARVPFFFKQWGGVNKKKTGRILEGRTWDELPTSQLASASV